MTLDKTFPGRVIFDHLPKTAGQAINAWLFEELGSGCVTVNLIGNHSDLIRQYGGLYSVISAHVSFYCGEGLDPRYQYLTIFREPIDRAISWIFFILNDAGVTRNTICLKEGASQFLASDGYQSTPEFLESISNPYTEHFCRINDNGSGCDEDKIGNALAAIKQYDVVGLYENMPQFLTDVAALIGLPTPRDIPHINITTQRPQTDQVSPILRERILALNQLDLRLFSEVVAWKAFAIQSELTQALPLTASKWKKYEPPVRDRVVTTPDVAILASALREGYDIRHGQLMTFDVDFFLAQEVQDLEMGIHIFDSNRQWAFGINSSILGQSHPSLPNGSYRVSYYLVADLPAGKYTAGFAFAERLPEGRHQELAWRDVMCEFQVYHQISKTFEGYAYLPTEISLCPIHIPTRYFFLGDGSLFQTLVGRHEKNNTVSTGQTGWLVYGPYISLKAGLYQVLFRCTVGKSGLAGARVDVVADKGNRVFAECNFGEPDEDGWFIMRPITLNASCSDFEIRVWVTDNTELQISMIEIAPWWPNGVEDLLNSEIHLNPQADIHKCVQEESVDNTPKTDPQPLLSAQNDLIGNDSGVKIIKPNEEHAVAPVAHGSKAPTSRNVKNKKSRHNNKRR